MTDASLLAVYQELSADWARREPALSKMGGLGRAAWSEWAAEGDAFRWDLPYPAWVRAVTADLIKVGPKGYIHGWIKVGVGNVGDLVHHPEHGHGKITRVGSKTVGVHFDSGAYHAFEHGGAGEGHFVERAGRRVATTKPASKVEDRIRAAYTKLLARPNPNGSVSRPGSHLPLADVRAELGDVPRDEQDAALKRLLSAGAINLVPQEDQKRLRAVDREAALSLPMHGAGGPVHLIAIGEPEATTSTPRPSRYTDKQKLAIWDAMPADERNRWLGLGKGPEDITPGNVRAGLVPVELTSPPARAPRAPKPAARTPDEHRAHLATLTSRDEARAYVAPLKGKELNALARDLSVDHHRTVAERRDAIVESTVGARTDAEAIRGGNWLKPAVPEHLMESAPTVPVDRLRAGDYAKVTGEDQYGKPTTLTGYVSNPTPVRIGSRGGKKRDAMAVQVTETRGGANGWRGAVYVAPDAHVTPMPEPGAAEPAAPSPRMQAEALRVQAAARQRALDAGLPAAGSTSRRHHTPAGPVGTGRGDTAAGWAGRVHEQQQIDELNARAEQVAATPAVASELTQAAEDRILRMDRPGAPAHIRETAAGIRERRASEAKDRIRAAYAARPKAPGGWVGLADLRADLGDLNRNDVDTALRELSRESGVRLAPVDNTRALRPEDRAAAIRHGDSDRHMIAMGRGEDAARARQSEIDRARAVGGLVAEAHELVNHQATPEAIRSRLTAHGNRVGVDAAPLAVLAHDPPALLAAADEMGGRAGLERVGSAGEVVPFNPRAHDPLGEQIREGSNVEVVRPGHVATLVSGERVPVSKATVMPAGTPGAPARISVQPRGRRPAALKQPPEPAAPATQYQVIQVNSRGQTTAVLGHAASENEALALRQQHVDRLNNGPENQRRRRQRLPIVDAAHDIKIEERVPGQGQNLDPITAPAPAKLSPTEAAQQALQHLRAGGETETTLKALPVAALRELARIHGIVGSLGGRDEVKRMKKADLVREMTPWF